MKTREAALDLLFQRGGYEAAPTPDMVLLDWNLSQHSGKEVIQAAKSIAPTIPVIVMMGSEWELQRVEFCTPAADGYIKKQIDPDEYIALLRSCGAEQ